MCKVAEVNGALHVFCTTAILDTVLEYGGGWCLGCGAEAAVELEARAAHCDHCQEAQAYGALALIGIGRLIVHNPPLGEEPRP